MKSGFLPTTEATRRTASLQVHFLRAGHGHGLAGQATVHERGLQDGHYVGDGGGAEVVAASGPRTRKIGKV